MKIIQFTVPGLPQPQGSARAFVVKGKAVVTGDNPKVRSWRADVKTIAMDHWQGEPASGPVMVTVQFTLPRPQSHYGTGKNAGVLKATAPERHPKKPDLDKLVRAVLDALTGVCWRDDAQVCYVGASKYYGDRPETYFEVEA